MNKFTVMAFQEGGCGSVTQIVGRKTLFKSKEDFLNYCATENEDIEEMVANADFDTNDLIIDDISEGYVRYYPRMPEGFEIESGWTFCKKGKGAVEVYIMNLD